MKRKEQLTWKRRSRPAHLAWFAFAGLILGLFLTSMPAYLLWWGDEAFFGFSAGAIARGAELMRAISVLASLFSALLSFGLAALLFFRRGADPMALFASYYLQAYGIIFAGPLEQLERLWPGWSNFALNLVSPLFLFAPTVALFCLFPSGRFRPRRAKWLVVSALVLSPVIVVAGPFDEATPLTIFIYLFFAAASIAVLIYRYRYRSSQAERQQTKWAIAGFILWIATIALLSVPYVLRQNLPPGEPAPWWAPGSAVGWWLSVGIVPVSLTLAIFRYRLWEIDRLLSRTLVYTLLTAVLALTYFGSVVLFQSLFRAVVGQDSPLAIVLSTLLIAALFRPLRRRLQRGIDRRFYRRNYDAAQALAHFAATARDEVDLDELTGALIQTVEETLQPSGVRLWLGPDNHHSKEIRIKNGD